MEVARPRRPRAAASAAAKQIEGFADVSRHAGRDRDAPGRVLADEDRIVQTLTNLLGNAIKFSEPGEPCVSSATEHDSEVVLHA